MQKRIKNLKNLESDSSNSNKDFTVEESKYHDMISSLKTDDFSKNTIKMISSLLLIYAFIFLIREPVRKIVYAELEGQLLTADVASWAVFGHVDAIQQLNNFRALREG